MLSLTASLPLFGQVSGWVKEKDTKRGYTGASIMLLRADTSLLAQTQSRQEGKFVLSDRLHPGDYIVFVSAPGFESIYQKLLAIDSLPIDVGILLLLPKSDSLQAVTVRPSALRPKFKGDTIEYNTSNIKMRPNAAVEEMLGRLPGLQIDASGNITYNGEKISRLLVDGEDFFGADPTLVTRNFDASRIDKVQVLDRKSDQAVFTGIDDGSRTKTLNLIMKQDSKNGYFGKVEGGADMQGKYSVDELLAEFKQFEQIAVAGFMSNTGSLGFNADLGESFGGIFFNNNTSDPLGASAGIGIPRFLGSALHYANTWAGSSDHLLGNYQYSSLYTRPVTTSLSIQTLPDSVYGQYRQSHSTNKQQQHWAFATYDVTLDSLSAIRIGSYGSSTLAENQYGDTALSTFNGVNANTSLRTIRDNVSRQNLHFDANYRLRARHHPGKVFSISASWSGTNSTTSGYVYSIDRFFQPNGVLESLDTTDQRKLIADQTINAGGGLSYSEPLSPKTTLGFSYGLNYTGDNEFQGTYGRGDGKYSFYIDSLSSHLQPKTINQEASVNLQGGDNRLSYIFGTGFQRYSYIQKDLRADSTSCYKYWNIVPHAQLRFTLNHFTNFFLEYTAAPQPPTIAQLQPIINNSNPLSITLGNPRLKPGFNQNWRFIFSRISKWIYGVNLNFGLTSNSISSRTIIDALGQQVSQPVNVDGGKTGGVIFSLRKQLLGLDLGLNLGESFARSFNYLNSELNQTDSYTETGGFSAGYYSAEKYAFQLKTKFSYFDTRSSVNVGAPIRYWTQSHSGNLTLFFIRGFELHTDATYNWEQATSSFTGSTSVLLWNASILHNFLANRLVIKFQANNLLNANAGISRTNSANLNSQSTTNILGRYWLFCATYHFDHQWKKK
jgi:Outer membrane protein beta-barrel family